MIGLLAAVAWDLCPICAVPLRPFGPVLVRCPYCGYEDERE